MDKRTTTVTIGKRSVVLQEVSAGDSLALDLYVPSGANGMPNLIAMTKVYALGSVRKIDEETFNPLASEIDFQAVAGVFSAWESMTLVELYGKAFDEELPAAKNASSDQGSST